MVLYLQWVGTALAIQNNPASDFQLKNGAPPVRRFFLLPALPVSPVVEKAFGTMGITGNTGRIFRVPGRFW
jgi:hypothetical protein